MNENDLMRRTQINDRWWEVERFAEICRDPSGGFFRKWLGRAREHLDEGNLAWAEACIEHAERGVGMVTEHFADDLDTIGEDATAYVEFWAENVEAIHDGPPSAEKLALERHYNKAVV